VGKDEASGGLFLRDDIRHGSLRHRSLDGRIGAAAPPGVKQLFDLRFRIVIGVGDDRQKLQPGFTGVVDTQPDGLNAVVGERCAEIALALVVGQNRRANRHRALLANFGAGHE
jgi:hypothetical protein